MEEIEMVVLNKRNNAIINNKNIRIWIEEFKSIFFIIYNK